MERGKVVRVESFGLGFLQPEGSEEQYPFRFDQISGYTGESPRKMGLQIGSAVNFTMRDDRVEMIQLPRGGPLADAW
jgi:hypothetical protein